MSSTSREVDDGLELWLPVMKAQFPLAASDVSSVFTTLKVDVPALGREHYALDQLIGELIDPDPDLPRRRCPKRRRRYLVDECMVEFTDITAGGVYRRTVAVDRPTPRWSWRRLRGWGWRVVATSVSPAA